MDARDRCASSLPIRTALRTSIIGQMLWYDDYLYINPCPLSFFALENLQLITFATYLLHIYDLHMTLPTTLRRLQSVQPLIIAYCKISVHTLEYIHRTAMPNRIKWAIRAFKTSVES